MKTSRGTTGASEQGGTIWGFPSMEGSKNGWFIRENPIKVDDLGVTLFQETTICSIVFYCSEVQKRQVNEEFLVLDLRTNAMANSV